MILNVEFQDETQMLGAVEESGAVLDADFGDFTGYEVGKADGYDKGFEQGKTQGVTEGIEQGKQAEYDKFWDNFQNYGNRTNYSHAFSETKYNFWSNGINPKYPIVPINLDYGFYGFSTEMGNNGYVKQTIDFAEFCVNNNIDLSRCVSMQYAFYNSQITKIPPLKTNDIFKTFFLCGVLKTIEDIGTNESDNILDKISTDAFNGCSGLVNIRFSCIINTTLNFSSCKKLSYESLVNIKEQLKDNSGITAKTITFGSTNLAKFTADDLAEIEAKGWTVK